MSRRLILSLFAATIAAGALSSQPAQAATLTVPTTVSADCSRDVTKDLNSWIASAPNGSVLSLGAARCYRVDGTLQIIDRRDLTIEGNGATVRTVTTPSLTTKITRQQWLIQGGANITVRNLVAQGTNPTPVFDVRREWLPLFEIAGASNVTLDRVTGRNSWGDFVFITPDVRRVTNSDGTGAVLPNGINVRNSSASVIGRHAVTCNGCDNVVVDNNSFTDIGYQVFDVEVEASTWHARDLTFSNNSIGGRIALSVLASGDTVGHDVSRVTLRGNTMLTQPATCAPPVDVYETRTPRSDFVVTGNRFKTLSNAMRIAGVTGATLDGNRVEVSEAGCTNSGVAMVVGNLRAASLRNNLFLGARRLVVASGVVEGVSCGNQLAEGGPARPVAC